MRSEYSDVYGWWAPFLNVIGKGMARIQTGPIQAEIMKTRKALSDSSIIDLILKRLQSCDDLLETSDKQYTFLTNALANFALVDVSTGARLSRMVRTMADILQDMVTRAIHFDTGDAFLEACLKLFFIIGHKLRTGNSIYAVCEALDHFLLETLVDFSERFDHMLGPTYTGIPRESMKFLIDHSVLNILSDIMPKYMGYESVQLALFPVVTDDDSTKQMYSTVAREKWTRMCQSYGEATGLCDGSQDIFSISLCDNPMHGTRKKARKLWRCSGCESTWYCSKECQREHWVSVTVVRVSI
ncbi:hypothetical protein BDQ17DRAFT_461562 [Cyathus striatus]|nr:hypothetical protein BDQ17DRAFT_461562 [Cyathus striatus]